MPSKIRPDDWDRLFAPNAPRRGGPLNALGNILVVALFVGLIWAGGTFIYNYRQEQITSAVATATAVAPTRIALATATAEARAAITATAQAIESGTAEALAQPTPEPSLGIGAVTSGGNLRSEPRVADDTIIGLIWPNDQVIFLEQRDIGGQLWFRIRVVDPSGDRGGQGVAINTEGWASSTLLTSPTPVPSS